MKLKNVTKGPKGVNTTTGTRIVAAGETADVVLSAEEKKVVQGTGWFQPVKEATPKSGPKDDEDKGEDEDEGK